MEQPIISKHCHALLDVPPIHREVTEIARGSNKHGRCLASCQTVILIQNSCLFPDQSPKTPNIQAIPSLFQIHEFLPDFPAPYEPWVISLQPRHFGFYHILLNIQCFKEFRLLHC